MSLDFPRPPAWTERARCAETDARIFYPGDGERGTAAKRICASCPVVDMCLEYAIEQDDRFGIYGGMTVTERNRVKTQRTKDAAA